MKSKEKKKKKEKRQDDSIEPEMRIALPGARGQWGGKMSCM